MSQIVLNVQDPFDPNSILVYDMENKTISLIDSKNIETETIEVSNDYYLI